MLKIWRYLISALTISTAWVNIVQAEEVFTPKTIIEKLEIRDNCPRERVKKAPKSEFDILGDFERRHQRCDEVTAVFAGNDLKLRKIAIEEGATEYFEEIKIIALPNWSLINYEVKTPHEPLSVWHNVKTQNGNNEGWHIYFIFKVNMTIQTDKLNEFINDYLTKSLRIYEGTVSYQIFKTRTDKKLIPVEDFTQGAKVFYVEINVNVTKIDRTQLPSP